MSKAALTDCYQGLMIDLCSKVSHGRPAEDELRFAKYLNGRIKNFVDNIPNSPYFESLAVPGESHLHLLRYWNKLEGLSSAWEDDDSNISNETFQTDSKEIMEIQLAIGAAKVA